METHVATRPNQRAMTVQEFKVELASHYQKQVENYFMGDKEGAMKFMSAAVYCVQKTPALLECSRDSLIQALMYCAEYRIYPTSFSGEAYIIPYKGKAQFQLGYQGLLTLLQRAGVQSVQSSIVYQNDKFEYEEGLEPKLVHQPNVFSKGGRGEAIGVYAIAMVNNTKIFKVMSKEDIMKFKELSQAKGSQYSPWNSGNDPELWMWKKTCIKQLAKTLPKNEDLQKAVAQDNEEDSTLPKAKLDADGPATAKAIHAPVETKTKTKEPKITQNEEEIIINQDAE